MPIPEDFGQCVAHFMKKGKPRDQAMAICVSVRDRKNKSVAGDVAGDHLKKTVEQKESK